MSKKKKKKKSTKTKMKILFYLLVLLSLTTAEVRTKQDSMVIWEKFDPKSCKGPVYCPDCACAKGLITVRDPTGCTCPRCICPKEKMCNYDLERICPQLPCAQLTHDPCGCKCPTCKALKCPWSNKSKIIL